MAQPTRPASELRTTVSFFLGVDSVRQFDAIAQRQGVTRSVVLRWAAEEYLRPKDRPTPEGVPS